jgi:hypothetical protein
MCGSVPGLADQLSVLVLSDDVQVRRIMAEAASLYPKARCTFDDTRQLIYPLFWPRLALRYAYGPTVACLDDVPWWSAQRPQHSLC